MNKNENLLESVQVLDHGFVELIDVLGSDQAIVDAARTSYDKGTKKVSSTRQLLRYLMRHKHMGPFEFGDLVFRIRCPLFVARQWFRHRTGSYNEASLRYSEARDEYYTPKAEWITTQDRRNRQARTNEQIDHSNIIREKLDKEASGILRNYNQYLEEGVAREIARINLPLSYYTTFCFKSDLRNLLNFLSLRTDSHAQFEIRQYANIMEKMVEKFFPLTIQAWRDYHKNSVLFSEPEKNILRKLFEHNNFDLQEKIQDFFKNEQKTKLAKLEQEEFLDKIKLLFGEDASLNYLKKK